MKTFKQLILLFTISIFSFSCDSNDKGVGMNTWEGVEDLKFHLGTEDPIETVMEFDNADREKDYEKMRLMTTDSTTFTGGNGIVKSVDEYFDQKSNQDARLDSLGASWTWKTTAIFSVDLAPGEGGELVHNYFDGKYTEGDIVNNVRGMEMWYIVDGKVIRRTAYFQDIPEENEEENEE